MRHTAKLLISIFLLLTLSAHAQEELMVLHHHGNIKVFAGTDMSIPINEAADGDTLFLNPGTYSSPSTITKCVSIIGSGAEGENKTRIDLGLSYRIPANSTTDSIFVTAISSYSFGDFSGEGLKKVHLQKVSFSIVYIGSTENKTNIIATIDRCLIGTIRTPIEVDNGSIANCYNSIICSCNFANCRLTNCYIDYLYPPYTNHIKQTYLNCILSNKGYNDNDPDIFLKNMFFQNCLFGFEPTSLSVNNCYTNTSLELSKRSFYNEEMFNQSDISIALLKQSTAFEYNKYFGTDGTIVGSYGGKTPFSLELHSPEVVSHNVTYDKDKKRMNVNVKFQAK